MGGNLNFDLDEWSCPRAREAAEAAAWEAYEAEKAEELHILRLLEESERVDLADDVVVAEARRGVAR